MAAGTLQQLQATGTVLIADTADFDTIARFNPSEGTTNPSLPYAAAKNPSYAALVSDTIAYAHALPSSTSSAERLIAAVDYLAAQFGTQICQLTGKVSTEVDVSLSFNTVATVSAALRIIDLYEKQGVPKDQVRINISATWEGIQAARILQKEHGVSCLVTVVFGMTQVIAAAEAGADAIAPYVGRIADWGWSHSDDEDLGVATVSKIQNYLRKYGFETQVMAASFCNTKQIRELAGIDLLTAAPAVVEALEKETEPVDSKLTLESAQAMELAEISFINDEVAFRWAFNGDACTVEKSAEAMRRFYEDTQN